MLCIYNIFIMNNIIVFIHLIFCFFSVENPIITYIIGYLGYLLVINIILDSQNVFLIFLIILLIAHNEDE